MMLNVHAEQHEVRPSMEIFRFQSVSRDERRWLNHELQAKVEELESFYASYKLSTARRRNQTEDFGESAKFDRDLLLKMADDLERNLKLSQSEVSKGRAYEDYAARRGAKLREEEVGWKASQRRKELVAMENRFEERWVELKTKGREGSRVENKKEAIDDSLKNHNLDSSTSARSPPKSSSKNINLDSPTASLQSLPSFPCLSKENMKPYARSNTATNSTPSQTSKSAANLDELKQRMEHSKSSTVLEVRSSIDKPSELENVSEIAEDMMNQQVFITENDGLERQIAEEEAFVSHIELDGEEPRPSEESGTCDFSSEKTEISRHEEEADGELVDASKLNSSLDSERESSNPEVQNAGEAADAARARKKWVIAEKTTLATGNSFNKLLKDFVKQFKKLIKLGRKGKNTHNAVSVALKLSSEHLKKSRNDYSVPDRIVGLHNGKIFPRKDIKSTKADQLERFPKCKFIHGLMKAKREPICGISSL
ncbi:uncharacterized protein LOC122012678 [Zingiber officinale]|uniref:uncharacterized protein LOC122012678 n=1 Tax=Zingiber officinale TaxID=94328 RepID=UPI001C4CAC40|nr:uncharacterized protein LOC122012678 [Zingiber officinale]